MLRRDAANARSAWIAEAIEPADRVNRAGTSFLADVNEAGERLDFHSLRVSTASWLVMSGATLTLAQRRLRDSTPTLTANVYTRHAPEAEAEAVARRVVNGDESRGALCGAMSGPTGCETLRIGAGNVMGGIRSGDADAGAVNRGISRASRGGFSQCLV